MLNEDVLFLSVTELSRRVRARQLSPVELTESYLDRSRTVGKKLNAYATLTPDLALKQAHAAEKEIAAGKYRGPLHGIPYAISYPGRLRPRHPVSLLRRRRRYRLAISDANIDRADR